MKIQKKMRNTLMNFNINFFYSNLILKIIVKLFAIFMKHSGFTQIT